MKKKYLLLVVGIVTAFALGYGAIAEAWPIKDRNPYRGYFHNQLDTSGDYVWRPGAGPSSCRGGSTWAIPSSVNTKTEFINFVKCKLNNGNAQERVGARFIIQTMRGKDNSPPSSSEIADWEARIRNPALNVNWDTTRSYTVNSYYQGCCGGGSNPVDDAFYNDNGSGRSIVFGSGSNAYVLRRQCANPVGNGSIGTLPPAPPSLNFDIDGRTTISDTTVLPGQAVTWRHYLDNEGPTSTSPTTISWRVYNSLTGGQTLNGNAGTFADDQEKMVRSHTLTIPASAAPGTQFCRHIWFSPENENGGSDVGSRKCATVQYDFNLTPIINFTVNGGGAPGSIAEQGDTIQFSYSVNNGGSTVSQTASCDVYGLVRPGSYPVPTPHDSASDPGYVPPPTGCPRTFPRNSTTSLTTETITAPAPNQTVCRALWVNPATTSGSSRSAEVCIRIVAKPYLKVYGGDVMAGSGLETAPDTCTNNADAAIVSWNKRSSATSYAGAGVQYAGFALRAIADFATGRGNAVGGTTPQWLSFANTTNVNAGSGQFGGMFGSVPCIPDYYGNRPASTTALPPNVSAMTTGVYGSNNAVNLSGGVVNPGEKITVYVDGNVFINSNITYTPNWSFANTPLFQLVVRGNIYVGSGVTQLDGVYIAQRNGSNGGTIYTCATSAAPLSLANGAFFGACNSKLTVNGAFMAHSVEFLRTAGSLSQSVPGEASGASTAGEVFNFNPSLWMVQPLLPGAGADSYDAITSLPPVL